jgi:hypothetical protein
VPRYRDYAAHCLKAAEDTADAATKLALLDIAQLWTMLAGETERTSGAIEPVRGQEPSKAD